jgi:hypothetical protein
VLRGGAAVRGGAVDVGKHLRPSYRSGRMVLFVARVTSPEPAAPEWRAVKLD